MTTILVTGATGTVGSELIKQLVSSSSSDNDIIIRVVAIQSQNKIDNFKEYKTLQIVDMDYNKSETIVDALNHVNKLFLLTLPSPNVAVYSNLVKEIRKYGSINHIVKLSSMAARRLDSQPQLDEYIEKKRRL
jgi:uncharacterized protein YbjT (DUF2867 family)